MLRQNDRAFESKQLHSLQLVGNPSSIAVGKEKKKAGIRLQNSFVLLADFKYKMKVVVEIVPLVPFSKVCFDYSASRHSQSSVVRDIVGKVGTYKVDGIFGKLFHSLQTVSLDYLMYRFFHNVLWLIVI